MTNKDEQTRNYDMIWEMPGGGEGREFQESTSAWCVGEGKLPRGGSDAQADLEE